MTGRRRLDPTIARAIALVLATGALVGLALAAVKGVSAGGAVLAGAGYAAASLYALARSVGALLGASGESAGGGAALAWRLFAPFRMLIVLAGATALLASRRLAPLPFVAGLALLPVGIVLAVLTARAPPGD